MKKNEPRNCSECKFCTLEDHKGGFVFRCKKSKEKIILEDWCSAGRKK